MATLANVQYYTWIFPPTCQPALLPRNALTRAKSVLIAQGNWSDEIHVNRRGLKMQGSPVLSEPWISWVLQRECRRCRSIASVDLYRRITSCLIPRISQKSEQVKDTNPNRAAPPAASRRPSRRHTCEKRPDNPCPTPRDSLVGSTQHWPSTLA
jgi:hypothetical protein